MFHDRFPLHYVELARRKKTAIGYFCASFTLKSNYKRWPTSIAPYPTTNTKYLIKQAGHLYRLKHAVFNCASSQTRDMASSFLRFLDHTQGLNTVVRNPLDEWWARRRDLYLTSHNTQTDKRPCSRRNSNPQPCKATHHTGIKITSIATACISGILMLCFPPGCFFKMQPLLLVRPLCSCYGDHRRRRSNCLEKVVTQLQGGQE